MFSNAVVDVVVDVVVVVVVQFTQQGQQIQTVLHI